MDESRVREIQETYGLRMLETHISWVLLGDEHVYKIKKPVKLSFLDFSTLEGRKFFCEEEVRLNRRLAPGVYLGVVPVVENARRLSFGGSGAAVDFAVKMRRLPDEERMDLMLAKGKIGKAEIKRLAGLMADFHDKAETAPAGCGTPEVVRGQIADLGNYRDAIEQASGLGKWVDGLLARSADFLKRNDALLRKRLREGKVKDCHGDLHSGNVFFGNGIRIIDCIEFSESFRCIDVASDIAFMAMDLDYAGRKDLSELFVGTYVRETEDQELDALLPLYKCYRANVRAKVAAIEWKQGGSEESRQRMDRYILLAAEYSRGL